MLNKFSPRADRSRQAGSTLSYKSNNDGYLDQIDEQRDLETGSRLQNVLSKQKLHNQEEKSPARDLDVIEEIQITTDKKAKKHPFKPEITEAQEKNEQGVNLLLNLGGKGEMKEVGKKAVHGNINTKPSQHENMYEYVEGFH